MGGPKPYIYEPLLTSNHNRHTIALEELSLLHASLRIMIQKLPGVIWPSEAT